MQKYSILVALGVLLLAGSIWLAEPTQAAGGAYEATVRLYSDGQVVGQWVASAPGRNDGTTFVFPIRKGARELEMRISGTFSVEQQP